MGNLCCFCCPRDNNRDSADRTTTGNGSGPGTIKPSSSELEEPLCNDDSENNQNKKEKRQSKGRKNKQGDVGNTSASPPPGGYPSQTGEENRARLEAMVRRMQTRKREPKKEYPSLRSNNLGSMEIKDRFNEHYELLLPVLGRGAFSVVYKSIHTASQQTYAVKTIPRSLIQTEDQIRRLKTEISILHQLDHPNICKLYEVYEEPEKICLVLEFIDGEELFDLLIKRQKFTEAFAKAICIQIAKVLVYLHSLRLAHRDLKAENILLPKGSDGQYFVKLIDFGLSKAADNLKSKVGSPTYVAPEVLTDPTYDISADMWSFGIVIYTMLCGSFPFNGDTHDELYEKIVYADYPVDENMSADAKDIIFHLLTKNPKERYSAEMVLEHPWLKDVVSPSPTPLTITPPPPPTSSDLPTTEGVRSSISSSTPLNFA